MSRPQSAPGVTVPKTNARTRRPSRDWPSRPRKDPHTRLIAQVLELAGPDSSVIATSSRPWASATFLGARHLVIMRIRGAGHADRATLFAEALPHAEFSISGHIVADICVDERSTGGINAGDQGQFPTETLLRLSALTIEDW